MQTHDGKLDLSASLARFSFVDDPNRWIDVFNIHPSFNKECEDTYGDVSNTRYFINWSAAKASSQYYYSPIVVGDFNCLANQYEPNKPESQSWLPQFEDAYTPPTDVVGVLIGKPSAFRPLCLAKVAKRLLLPALPESGKCPGPDESLVSDHCGAFASFEWNGPEACAFRDIDILGPREVVEQQHYTLAAIPVGGGGLAWAYRWSNGASADYIDATAGTAGTSQTWAVEVTDRDSGKVISKSVTVAFTPRRQPPPPRCIGEQKCCPETSCERCISKNAVCQL